jgi:hypothetical protein
MNDIWFKDNIYYCPQDQFNFTPSCIKANIDLELLNDFYECR